MRLKRLELQGFKSFLEKTEIVFDQGITGIVGPNGSGKSNIGDAVRWVLGEQSARVLRGAKMEDVIFNGTQKRKRASFCEVSLVFDNEDNALKSAFAEVCVTRRVYRNGDSEYYLNKAACRLRDILELFRDTGIGREGYSLIGQGRIDEILSQKGEDRRQVFEEAAGIMTYRVRKEEAERKLARTGENLTRVYDILHELENRLGPLSEQAAVAREYQTLFERLRTLEINIFLLRYDKVRERVTALTQTMEGLRDVLLSHEARINEISAQREMLDNEIQALEEALSEARREQNEKIELLHEAEMHCERLDSQKKMLLDAADAASAQRQETANRRNELLALHQEGGETEKTREHGLLSARQALEEAQIALDALNRSSHEAEEALNRHKSDILAAVNRMSDARETETRQQAIRTQMQARLSDIEKSITDLSAQRVTLEELEKRALDVKKATEENFRKLQEDAAETQRRLDALKASSKETTAGAQQLSLSVQADASRLRLMEEMSREMEGYQQSVRRALDFSKNNKNVRGVLARLISVPRELETAIDMALGGALQNIVTTDEDTAKGVIDYLRQNKLGRATFLPMTSVRSRVLNADERRLLSMQGCLGVASELISYQPEYRGVVENLLGRTVIADNLEHGIPIMRAGRHQFRLVTLTGDVMHSGGSMTGGTAQGRATSLLGREREIKDLRTQVENKRARLADMRKSLEKITDDHHALQAQQADALNAVHQEEIAVARETERAGNAHAELEALCLRLSQTENAREQLRQSILEIDEDLKKAQEVAQTVTVDREAMEHKTDEMQRLMLSTREKADAQREKVTALQLSFADEMHLLDTLKRDRSRREEEIRSADEALRRMDEQAEARSRQLAEIEKQIAEGKKTLEELRFGSGAQQEKVQQMEAVRLSKAARQRECIRISDETHALYDQDSAKLHRTELAQSKAQTDLNQMCEHILNAYDLTYAGAEELRSEESFDLPAGEKEAASLRARIREMGTVNVASIEEYAKEKERFDTLTAQRDDLLKAQDDLTELIEKLLKQMRSVFVGEFEKLGTYFSETFTRLFGGGQAELRLADPDDPLNCAIDIIAQPPGKKLQLLSLLSGGERALTAIAILFAMLKLKPTPFCILDEIEAALDEANIAYFADYLAEYKETTQFVVVTHRKGTMERCDALYGVAMEERGVSRMVSVNLEDYQN